MWWASCSSIGGSAAANARTPAVGMADAQFMICVCATETGSPTIAANVRGTRASAVTLIRSYAYTTPLSITSF
jgi:ribose 5-phosphate isomerase RpiB